MTKGIGGHHRGHMGATSEWLTPPEIIKATGPFDLDPCAPVSRPWDMAAHHYTIKDDGRSKPWFGKVWCNPPYGPETWTWLQMLANHGNGIALTFARTETVGFVDTVWQQADAVMFLHGRLHFHYPDGTRSQTNSGGPSVLIAYGHDCMFDLMEASLDGTTLLIGRTAGSDTSALRTTQTKAAFV